MELTSSPSFGLTVRVELEHKAGRLASLLAAVAKIGGVIGAVDTVETTSHTTIRDIGVEARDANHQKEILAAIAAVPGAWLIAASDQTFLAHLKGKIDITSKIPISKRSDLSIAYTPGVGRVSAAIAKTPELVWHYTIKGNCVAIVTDGTAVLGLGDIGPEAALPVMEGKAQLFKRFADVNAFPICLATKDPDLIVKIVKAISPAFGGINLEDISAPRCFEIERRLKEELDIPVFHDDQHGTAVVVLAALQNALRLVGKKLENLKTVVVGAGAAGVACVKILQAKGLKNVVLCDRVGALYRGRKEHMDSAKEEIAKTTNPENLKGSILDVASGADFLLGVSGPGVIPLEAVQKMAKDAIVFALANPVPEIQPEEAGPYVRIMATGRSDYPNQINNALCFPGIFKGALACKAREINEAMKVAAADAIASLIPERALDEEDIIPSIFHPKVAEAVADAVREAAIRTGVARQFKKTPETISG